MSHRTTLVSLVLALGVCRSAGARERLAVLIVADADADSKLADNLTEVAIAKIAETPGRELVGAPELRKRLNEIAQGGDLGACLAKTDCLVQVGVAAGANRAVIGNVRHEDQSFMLTLALTDMRTAVKQAEVSRKVSPDVSELIVAVQEGVGQLLQPKSPLEPTPGGSAAIVPPPIVSAAGSPAPSAFLMDEGKAKPASSSPPYIAYGAGALAVACIGAAVVTGTIATGTPEGNTRAEVQADLERRQGFARATNGLWVAGGALTALS